MASAYTTSNLELFGAGQRGPYGSAVTLLVEEHSHSLPDKLLVSPTQVPWNTSPCSSFVRCHLYQHGFLYTRIFKTKICTFLKFSSSQMLCPIGKIQSPWTIITVQMTPKSKCLALASFQFLRTYWAFFHGPNTSHTQGRSQISVCHSHPLYSTKFSLSSWHHWSSSTFQVKTHYLSYPLHWLLISNNQTEPLYLFYNSFSVSSLPLPLVLPFFFTVYPVSYIQQIITKHSPWTRCSKPRVGDPEINKVDQILDLTELPSWASKQINEKDNLQ